MPLAADLKQLTAQELPQAQTRPHRRGPNRHDRPTKADGNPLARTQHPGQEHEQQQAEHAPQQQPPSGLPEATAAQKTSKRWGNNVSRHLRLDNPLIWLRRQFESSRSMPDSVRAHVTYLFKRHGDVRPMPYEQAELLARDIMVRMQLTRITHALVDMPVTDKRFFHLSKSWGQWNGSGRKVKSDVKLTADARRKTTGAGTSALWERKRASQDEAVEDQADDVQGT